MTAEAVLLVSFGGPEAPDEVLPFLRHVTAGRGIPDERLAEVGRHYTALGGVSPLNAQARALREALASRVPVPVVLAHRHVPPFLDGGLAELRERGVRRALVLLTSAFPSWSGCRSYRDELESLAGDLQLDVLGKYGELSGFTRPFADGLRAALLADPGARVVFTAHSIPAAQARDCSYEASLRRAAAQVCAEAGWTGAWQLAWQSRSGPPQVPWLEPDVGDVAAGLAAEGATALVVVPLGFVSDHVEVVWDLDTELAQRCRSLGLRLQRVATPGTDERFVDLLAALVAERLDGSPGAACPDGLTCCRPPAG